MTAGVVLWWLGVVLAAAGAGMAVYGSITRDRADMLHFTSYVLMSLSVLTVIIRGFIA